SANVAYSDTTPGNSGGRYRTTDVDIEETTDVGGGYDVGWIASGEWLSYTVNVAASGPYIVDARVASDGPGGTISIQVDGLSYSGQLTIPNTGGGQRWTDIFTTVTLPAGYHGLRVFLDALPGSSGAVGNLNYLTFTPTMPYGGITASIPGTIQAEDFD